MLFHPALGCRRGEGRLRGTAGSPELPSEANLNTPGQCTGSKGPVSGVGCSSPPALRPCRLGAVSSGWSGEMRRGRCGSRNGPDIGQSFLGVGIVEVSLSKCPGPPVDPDFLHPPPGSLDAPAERSAKSPVRILAAYPTSSAVAANRIPGSIIYLF